MNENSHINSIIMNFSTLDHAKEVHNVLLNVKLKALSGITHNLSIIKKLNMPQLSTLPSASSSTKLTLSQENIVWVDMEMTGLDADRDHILEVACLVTDGQLNIIEEGPDLIIHQPSEVLTNMNEWSTKQHRESGLTEKCQNSEVSLRDAEKMLLDFVKNWAPFNECPLGGNTVYMDRLFLMKHMPEFERHMHYRIVDVSSIKELCRRWYPGIYSEQPNKKELSTHRALEDIRASVAELKFYRERIFRHQDSEGVSRPIAWC